MTILDETVLHTLYPGTRGQIYLDSAAVGLLSRRVVDAMRGVLEEHSLIGSAAAEHRPAEIARTRGIVAQLVGGSADRVAFSQNTATAIALVINGLDWREGDNVVVPDGEFPSNLYPWLALRRRGVEIRRVPMAEGHADESQLIQALDHRSRVLAVSAVQYSSGYRYDLERLGSACSGRGTMLVVDGTQSVGALTMRADELKIDALCVSAHKWLLGPLGIGFAHFSEHAMDRLQPSVTGWRSVKEPFTFTPEPELADDARRFESGTENAAGVAGLAATASLVLEIGTAAVEEIVLERAARLEEICARHGMSSVRARPASRHSGILIVSSGTDDSALHARLIASKVRCSLRATGVRLSPHYFTTEADLAAFDEILREASLERTHSRR